MMGLVVVVMVVEGLQQAREATTSHEVIISEHACRGRVA